MRVHAAAERDRAQGQVPLPSVDQPKDRTDQGLPLPRIVLRFTRGSGNGIILFPGEDEVYNGIMM